MQHGATTVFFKMKLDKLIETTQQPILGIQYYWYSNCKVNLEERWLPSDHTHGALWLKHAPETTSGTTVFRIVIK